MEAKALFISNYKAIKKAKDDAFDEPKPEYYWSEVYFNIKKISIAHIDDKNDIAVCIDGYQWTFEYNKELWIRIKQFLSSREDLS